MLITFKCFAQQELITDGGFENTPWYNSWSSVNANGNFWGGTGGTCSPFNGSHYCWVGDQNEQTGVNYAIEDIYQVITIPSNLSSCVLSFYASINTDETTTTTAYDSLNVVLRTLSGGYLQGWYLSNLTGDYGIPGCQNWIYYTINIPATYFGQTLRVCFEITTDSSYPTIFRLDDASMSAYDIVYCSGLSTLTSPSGTFSDGSGTLDYGCNSDCQWLIQPNGATSVTLNFTSFNTESGYDEVKVYDGPSTAYTLLGTYSGTALPTQINSSGGSLFITFTSDYSITAPGWSISYTSTGCAYSFNQTSFTCPNPDTNYYSNIANVNSNPGCVWTASATSTGNWLSTTSVGNGNGSISISVQANSTTTTRAGSITINGYQTLIVYQPGINCNYAFSIQNFQCDNYLSDYYPNIASVFTSTGCNWSAIATSTGNWLSTSSSGNGNGNVSVSVLANPYASSRSGSVTIDGTQALIITQPGTTGIDEQNGDLNPAIFPVPVENIFYLKHVTEKAKIFIYDSVGKLITELENVNDQVNISDLLPGAYFARIVEDNRCIVLKFIKI